MDTIMRIANNFTKGTVQNDVDERFTDGALVGEPVNIEIFTGVGSDAGVLKNIPGNIKMSNYTEQFFLSPSAKCIGAGKNESEEKLYVFIKDTAFDFVIEYNSVTNTSARVLQSAASSGVLNFNADERITCVDIFIDAVTNDTIIAWSGDSNPPRIVNVTTAKTWAVGGFTNDEISVMKPSPIFAPVTHLTTSTESILNNFIEDKFLSFAYRYKYSDGYYSAPSSWSVVAFTPSDFKLDYQTYDNLGMVNLSNAVDVSFNVGPRDVVQVDLLFRESDHTTVYVVQQFVKSDEVWEDETTQTFQFSKSKIYTVLPESQYFRNFDNVPLSAKAQTVIGSRIAYANYVEGYDITDKIDFDVAVTSTEVFSFNQEGIENTNIHIGNWDHTVDFEELTFTEREYVMAPVADQMNYTTNEITMSYANLNPAAVNKFGRFAATVTPDSRYDSVNYSIEFRNGATILQTSGPFAGTQTASYDTPLNALYTVKAYVIPSTDVLIYDCEMKYSLGDLVFLGGGEWFIQDWYKAYFQVSCINTTTGPPSFINAFAITDRMGVDLTGFEFVTGKQLRVNMVLQSSLVKEHRPDATFYYNITEDYVDLADFMTNSTFQSEFEDTFTQVFKNNYISNEGVFVSMTDFSITYTGDTLKVSMPVVVYNVTEPSGITENKDEFFLVSRGRVTSTDTNAYASMHSNRDYETCLFYMDEQGRKTTSLVCDNNTVYIPADKSDLINRLSVTVNNDPPSWAKYYKFGIKQVKKQYETIYGNVVYEDGVFRWIKLEGENKNKVQEGDQLIVKTDMSGPLDQLVKVKVLEIKEQAANFITGNLNDLGDDISEPAGLYFKIKQGTFDANVTQESFMQFTETVKRRYASTTFVTTDPIFGIMDPAFVPYAVAAGTTIRFFLNMKAYGSIAFDHKFEITKEAEIDYLSVEDWFNAEIAANADYLEFVDENFTTAGFTIDGDRFQVKPNRDGTASRDIITEVTFDINFSRGTLIFETEPIEQLNANFFETPNVYTITAGAHEFVEHSLTDTFNCFAFGNGVESYKIKDELNTKSFSIDSNPSNVNTDGYKRIVRSADITYSEVYNSNSNVNRLNEFNLSLANYKDDVDKTFGPIYRLKGENTNLEVYQEDKDSIVYYGKDLLYNADGTTNLTGVPQVLGTQKAYEGEWGISQHPDSFDFYGYDSYHTDVKRGSVIKKSNNGLFDISTQGMKTYFRRLFKENTIQHINGKYDQLNKVYILNIKYNDGNEDLYRTWVYSDENNGWLTTQTFNPEDMIRVNGNFYSFEKGEVYKHNNTTDFNTFYGIFAYSVASFNMSHEPSSRKVFKTIEVQGNTAPTVVLRTDMDSGNVQPDYFEKKENVYHSYIRMNNETMDTSLLSYQGIGTATVNSFDLEFSFDLDSNISVGDKIRNVAMELVGVITSKTRNSLTLTAMDNIISGDYVVCCKPESAEQQGLLGYTMNVTATFGDTVQQEIFEIASEVNKSYL